MFFEKNNLSDQILSRIPFSNISNLNFQLDTEPIPKTDLDGLVSDDSVTANSEVAKKIRNMSSKKV